MKGQQLHSRSLVHDELYADVHGMLHGSPFISKAEQFLFYCHTTDSVKLDILKKYGFRSPQPPIVALNSHSFVCPSENQLTYKILLQSEIVFQNSNAFQQRPSKALGLDNCA